MKKIFLASDHGGFELKEKIKTYFNGKYEIIDLGPFNTESVDYPDFANLVVKNTLENTNENRGVLICGSGQGMAMRANKFPQIRAALVWSKESTLLSRQHNNANVLCLGGRLLDHQIALELVDIFMTTDFEGGRHQARIDKLEKPTHC